MPEFGPRTVPLVLKCLNCPERSDHNECLKLWAKLRSLRLLKKLVKVHNARKRSLLRQDEVHLLLLHSMVYVPRNDSILSSQSL